MPVRLAHFSDVHLTTRPLGWRARDWFNKRLPGWLNLAARRGRHFRAADRILTRLREECRARGMDHLVFSGDASALGFDGEIAHTAAVLGLDRPEVPPGLAVPGNHDYYVHQGAASGTFERCFGPWQTGERESGAVYPFAQRAGHVHLIGVNSCTANRLPWDSAGAVDEGQLARLERLLKSLPPGPRILVTHYPLYLRSGRREPRVRGLRNFDEVLRVAIQGGIGLWLHGHRHGPYHHVRTGEAPFPQICAGSATQEGLWSYGEYTLDGWQLSGVRRAWHPEQAAFEDVERFTFELHRS